MAEAKTANMNSKKRTEEESDSLPNEDDSRTSKHLEATERMIEAQLRAAIVAHSSIVKKLAKKDEDARILWEANKTLIQHLKNESKNAISVLDREHRKDFEVANAKMAAKLKEVSEAAERRESQIKAAHRVVVDQLKDEVARLYAAASSSDAEKEGREYQHASYQSVLLELNRAKAELRASRDTLKALQADSLAAATRAADEIAAYCEKEKRQELKLKETRLSQAVLQQRIEVAQKDSNLILSEEAAKREACERRFAAEEAHKQCLVVRHELSLESAARDAANAEIESLRMKLVASDNAASAAAAVAADTIADLRSKFTTANAAKAEAEAANMKSAHIIKGLTDEKLNLSRRLDEEIQSSKIRNIRKVKTKHGSMEDLSFLAAECDHLNRALDGAQEKATQTKIIHEEEKGKLRNEIAEAREELKKQRQSFEERIEKVSQAETAARAQLEASAIEARKANALLRRDKGSVVNEEIKELVKELATTKEKLNAEMHLHHSLLQTHQHDAEKMGSLENELMVIRVEVKDLNDYNIELKKSGRMFQAEIAMLRALRSLRSTGEKRALGELTAYSTPPHTLIEKAAFVVWSILQVFCDEVGISKRHIGIPEPSAVIFGDLPTASWSTSKAVFSIKHNLGGALERCTPKLVGKPKYSRATAAIAKIVGEHSIESVSAVSCPCGIIWEWATSVLILSGRSV